LQSVSAQREVYARGDFMKLISISARLFLVRLKREASSSIKVRHRKHFLDQRYDAVF